MATHMCTVPGREGTEAGINSGMLCTACIRRWPAGPQQAARRQAARQAEVGLPVTDN